MKDLWDLKDLTIHDVQSISDEVPRRANMAHIGQSRPDSGLGSQVKVLHTF